MVENGKERCEKVKKRLKKVLFHAFTEVQNNGSRIGSNFGFCLLIGLH